MTDNPFAVHDYQSQEFHAADVFEAPRLEKLPESKADHGMVKYSVYCAGAPHLARFSALTGIPVFKLGIARFGSHNRIKGLSRHRYAGYWGRSGHPVSTMTALIGAEAWVPIRLRRPATLDAEPARLLRFVDGAIEISLPAALHPETVDRLVADLLQNIELKRALATDAGRHRLRNGGVDPSSWFFTHYRNGDRPDQLAEARELYVFEPREHVVNLAQGLARLSQHYVEQRHGGG